jgi:hypothetical protein
MHAQQQQPGKHQRLVTPELRTCTPNLRANLNTANRSLATAVTLRAPDSESDLIKEDLV